MDTKQLQQERTQIYEDLYSNIIPTRVPVHVSLSYEATAQVGGINLFDAQWNPVIMAEAAAKVCDRLYSDVCPTGGSLRYPAFYNILESQSFVMGSNGFIQHPEVMGMEADDYEYLIENPLDCMLERILPKQYKSLKMDSPVDYALNFAKSILAYHEDLGKVMGNILPLVPQYGYYPGAPGGFTEAPFDFLADQLRGFRNITMDVRRNPQMVYDACEALSPILFKKGLPKVQTPLSRVTYPLHMPTFMREKDFEKLWWPSMKNLCESYASMGIYNHLWCEDDWTRYLDYLLDLPANTLLMFEYGDLKKIKDKVGGKHIIAGLYPVSLLSTGTKEECIDKAKELLDVLAPGGKYIFSMDKIIISINEKELENLSAVTEYVRDHGSYNNAGTKLGMDFKKEEYKMSDFQPIKSKYYRSLDITRQENPGLSEQALQKLQSYEDRMFDYITTLLI